MTPLKSATFGSPLLPESFSDYQRKGVHEDLHLNDQSPHSRLSVSKRSSIQDSPEADLYYQGMGARKMFLTGQIESKEGPAYQETIVQGPFTNNTIAQNRWEHDDPEEEIVMFEGVTFPGTEVEKTGAAEENVTSRVDHI